MTSSSNNRACGASALVKPPCIIRSRGAWATPGVLLLEVLSRRRLVKAVVSMGPRGEDVVDAKIPRSAGPRGRAGSMCSGPKSEGGRSPICL